MNLHNEESAYHPDGGRKLHVLDSEEYLEAYQIECENFQVISATDFGPSEKQAILAQKEEAFPIPEIL
ncbi:MAG: hypothetical protein HOC91_15500 [Nitrospinaceae bacterium]|nr:hypothetical protein [Nitrospinaceae bacterium]MBT3434885.1 hypothetical protein [Nitrospinaceae bacterium]MBT4095758.1 hypothetical protein [Nitrospinaceae bacterium]MBT4431915.1 hypothetical protein [Nitrospinaceae bacterium]MBT5947494.1 hypothetical protein [Nitrospinaceae bacterium]